MVSDNNIEALLEKYDNGETTLREEQQLRDYFAQNEVAAHLEPYKVMFQSFANTKKEEFTKEVPGNPDSYRGKKHNYVYQWISVAAVIVIMFGIFMQFDGEGPKSYDDLTKEEQLVYTQTKEAFDLLSSKFNEGASNVSMLGVVGSHFDSGVEKVEYVKEFSNTTDKILKKPNKNK